MTGFRPLDRAEYDLIERALAAYRQAAPVPCTSCQYCLPCPFGVDIPKNFGIYNHYLTNGKAVPWLMLQYNALPEKARAENCVGCGKCRKKCPQHIDIPGLMTEIKAAVEQARPQTPAWL